MKLHLFLGLFLCFQLRGGAQAPTVVTKNFKFNDGIYLSLNDWHQNKPSLNWEAVETRLATVRTTMQMQIEFLKTKNADAEIKVDSVWGVVVDGIPYVRLPQTFQKKSAMVFVGLTLRGRLCYFQFEDIEERKVPITAYIPQTGQPYFTKTISKKETVVREMVMRFDDGVFFDLNVPNFKSLIADDKELSNSFNDLKPNEIAEKLFKVLLIYNDRNPVSLK